MQTTNRLRSERPRKKYDFYETPIELCRASLERFQMDERPEMYTVLDVGAGNGVWGEAFAETIHWSEKICLGGVEIDSSLVDENYDFWYSLDYLNFGFDGDGFSLIFGNPPYSLAEEFVRHSLELCSDGGYVFFLLRLAFLESKKRHFGLFTEMHPKKVYVLSRRPSFFTTKDGSKTVDALAYAMFLWQKGYEGKPELDWLYWEYDK